jgi:hypothetical protein
LANDTSHNKNKAMTTDEKLEQVKANVAEDIYQLPYSFLSHTQQAGLVDIIALEFAKLIVNQINVPNA